MDVDHEYRKLNEWYQKCDALRPWLDSTENISNAEVGNEITVNEVKEKLPTVQVFCLSLFLYCRLKVSLFWIKKGRKILLVFNSFPLLNNSSVLDSITNYFGLVGSVAI